MVTKGKALPSVLFTDGAYGVSEVEVTVSIGFEEGDKGVAGKEDDGTEGELVGADEFKENGSLLLSIPE